MSGKIIRSFKGVKRIPILPKNKTVRIINATIHQQHDGTTWVRGKQISQGLTTFVCGEIDSNFLNCLEKPIKYPSYGWKSIQ